MRYDKPDATRKALVELIRAYGASWRDTPAVRSGEPDGVLGYAGQDVQVEFKSDKGQLRADQLEWHLQWRGSPVVVLRTREDVKELLERLRAMRPTRKAAAG